MAKSKVFGKSKYFLSMMLPAPWRIALLKWLVTFRYKSPQLSFPWNYSLFKKVLVLLPEEPLEAFHQIKTYLGLVSLLPSAQFFIVCTKDIAMLFRQIHPEATIIEYDIADRYLFSPEFTTLGKFFILEELDLCVLLERKPDLARLYLTGKTAAPIRAGYTNSGGFPFLNVHVNPSDEKKYLSDQNFLIARIFGASEKPRFRWSVAKETLNEISHTMHEFNMTPHNPLIGIDAGFYYNSFGETWTSMLIQKLKSLGGFSLYLYCQGEPSETTLQLLHAHYIPVFTALTPSRCAALISKSHCVVSGKTVFFELAHLIHSQVIGIFDKSEIALYFKKSLSTHGIAFDERPTDTTAEEIMMILQKSITEHTKN